MTAFLASLTLALGAGHTSGCAKTFTVPMGLRAITASFRISPVKLTTDQDYRLVRYIRCQRNPRAQPFLNTVWHRKAYLALHPPVVQPESSLAACIANAESRYQPDAVNGDHEGLAQWDPNAWATDGGTRYASSPLGASYNEQMTVLNDALPQEAGQWTPWDGCT
jgi:hypothetical protein